MEFGRKKKLISQEELLEKIIQAHRVLHSNNQPSRFRRQQRKKKTCNVIGEYSRSVSSLFEYQDKYKQLFYFIFLQDNALSHSVNCTPCQKKVFQRH